ncbi:conjugal transfer protein TraD [Candidatus Tisiphia endosymbiont of Beris chalybata]|uniref:conjugal transfer protein TraD n=1 Tax=Candidatus Tisiphia endosymbiont of Beris chalybata TaxID=3066262 RepID=UPI00312CA153
MQEVKISIQQRKNDTRKKIILGGLFVKAGLDHFYPHDPATLYGMLLHGKDLLHNSNFAQKFKELGKDLIKKV